MQHLVLDRWSRGNSAIHRLDPRAKIVTLLVFLIVLATAHRHLVTLSSGLLVLVLAVLILARLPVAGAVSRAAIVIPFSAVFAGISWFTGDPSHSIALLVKSYLSSLAVIAVVSTTPLPLLIRGMELTGCPAFLLMVAQFLYRYLFVISEEAEHMRNASASRGGAVMAWTSGRSRFRAAAGALAVLFARSYSRAEHTHHAMLARGFDGRIRPLVMLHFRPFDALFVAVASLAPALWRLAVERLH